VLTLRQAAGRLRDLVALGALLARCGGDAVGADQGPAHVLAAAGAPVTVLFGPQDPESTAPPAARAVRHAAPPPCMPCRSRRCRHRDGPVCMAFASGQGRPVPSASWLPGDST
jgi:ADP-heptose:LPS heptosyltransferase